MNKGQLVISLFLICAIGSSVAIAQNNTETEEVEVLSGSRRKTRNLRIKITVDDISFLQVTEGDRIKQGDVLSDNSTERTRLERQRKSLKLQINNLQSKPIPEPFKPKDPPSPLPLPKGQFLEEESQIAQAQLRLQQAQSILDSRSQLLKQENPQRRAETERAESALRIARKQVREQEELIKSMKDLRLSTQVLRHEEAKLAQLRSEEEQAESNYQRELAITQNFNIQQNQEIQNLQIAVQLAQSNLQVRQARLSAAQNARRVQEYEASIKMAQRIEEENKSKQLYSQQQARYAQSIRDRDYQISQLQIQLTNIEDKLALLPTVRSPRSGYVKRVKPWTGNNGKFTTTITISDSQPRRKRILRGKNSDRSTTSTLTKPR